MQNEVNLILSIFILLTFTIRVLQVYEVLSFFLVLTINKLIKYRYKFYSYPVALQSS